MCVIQLPLHPSSHIPSVPQSLARLLPPSFPLSLPRPTAANLELQIGGEEAIEGRLLAGLRVLLAPAAQQEALEGTSVQELSSWNCRVDPILDANVTRTAIALCAIALRCAGKVGLFYTYIWSLLPQIRGLFDSFAPQLLPHKVGGGSG